MKKSRTKTDSPKQYKTGSQHAGTFICTSCEGEINLKKPGRLPPCYKCSNTRYYRKQDAAMTEIENAGNYLRTIRLGKGLSTKDVTQATRISETNVVAIEDQNYEALPADTFTRGLLTIYAEFLEVDPEAVVAKYMEERNASSAQKKKTLPKTTGRILAPKRMAEPAQLSSMATAGILLLLIILSFSGYCIYTSWNPFDFLIKKDGEVQAVIENVFPQHNEPVLEKPSFPVEVEPKPEQAETKPLEAKPEQATAKIPEPKPVSPETEPVADEPQPVMIPDQQVEEESAPVLEATPVSQDKQEEDTQVAESIPAYTVQVNFLEDTSLFITLDDNEKIIQEFSSGETQSWSAESAITLTFAEPDSAEILVNGIPVTFPESTQGIYTLQIPQPAEPPPDE